MREVHNSHAVDVEAKMPYTNNTYECDRDDATVYA
jgi:hypothetical protein